MTTDRTGDPWDRHADWWQRRFADGTDATYRDVIVPLVRTVLADATRVVDVGAGEGQLGRVIAEEGAWVVAVEPAAAQAREAARRGGVAVARGDGVALPLGATSVDAALISMVLEHADDPDAVLAEVGRVLRPGGRVLWILNHPLVLTPDSWWVDDHVAEPPEHYWRLGPYLDEVRWTEEVDDGVELPYRHRPLGAHVEALVGAGLTITRMREPAPPDGGPGPSARAIPRLLVLEAERR